jgi:aminopeptidase-like protein
MDSADIEIFDFAQTLTRFPRSITGRGVRETLGRISEVIPSLKILEVPSGTRCFDWEIPLEWEVNSAYLLDPNGEKIIDFNDNFLHLIGYSSNFIGEINLNRLQDHLFSIPDLPNAIPYLTSYYHESWGFCIKHEDRLKLKEGNYFVNIDTTKFQGSLTYGELLIEGESDKEILLSTYICHPSMANNEISGPSVLTFISKYLEECKKLKYSYRIIFIPETIGSIAYISQNLNQLKEKVVAGFNLTCIGDNRSYSFLPSRAGNTISDNIAKHVLRHIDKNFIEYSWAERGSDERQFCAPGVDLPIATIMRSKYGTYPEYHSSLDDFGLVVTPEGLEGGFQAVKSAILALEINCFPKTKVLCEPQMSSRNLYPKVSSRYFNYDHRRLLDVLTWADGENSMLDIANKMDISIFEVDEMVKVLLEHDLISI